MSLEKLLVRRDSHAPPFVMARHDRAIPRSRVRVSNRVYDHLDGPLLRAMTLREDGNDIQRVSRRVRIFV